MPNYLYICVCGYSQEISHSMVEKLTPLCVDCGKNMNRKPQLGAVTFKGDGWAGKEKQ